MPNIYISFIAFYLALVNSFHNRIVNIEALMCTSNGRHHDQLLSICTLPEPASYYRSDVLQHHGPVYSFVVSRTRGEDSICCSMI